MNSLDYNDWFGQLVMSLFKHLQLNFFGFNYSNVD
jgi:hypothetical protein